MDYDSAPILAARANLLTHLGIFYKAGELAVQAIEMAPLEPTYHNSFAAVQSHINAFDFAIMIYQNSLRLDPNADDVLYRQGLLYERLGDLEQASGCYVEATDMNPDHALAQVSLAYIELVLGDYESAWDRYEARWQAQTVEETEPHILSNPRWEGQKNSVVLVYAEQGMGDTIHFVRYAHLLERNYGCKVYLEVQKSLIRLLKPLADRVFAYDGDIPTDIQYVIPLLSLPRVLGLNTEQALAKVQVPYLMVEPWDWASKTVRLPYDEFRVGLCWAGGQRLNPLKLMEVDKRRDISLWELSPLAELEGIHWVSLQIGEPSVQTHNSPIEMIDVTSELTDFYDTAALISCLDVVVTIDTSVAHLAGAIGKRVLLMVRFDPCWRWQNERNAKLCYPTVELFRQKTYGDWSSVVAEVKERLRALQQLSVS